MSSFGDYTDFDIRWQGHPKYNVDSILQSDLVEVIVQKLEMILFTTTSDVLGQECFELGANLEYYLWETSLSNVNIKQKIEDQIAQFVPEISSLGFDLKLELFEGTYQDIMQLNFTIQGYNVAFVFGT